MATDASLLTQEEIMGLSNVPSHDYRAPYLSQESAAFSGLAGEIVNESADYVEAAPVAILVQFLTMLSVTVGRNPHHMHGATRHGSNLFMCLVGASGKARKGDSEDIARAIFSHHEFFPKIIGGIGSGEGLMNEVADQEDDLEQDKRLLVIETEYAQLLRVVSRQGSIVSPTVRQAWDGKPLQQTVKHNPIKATNHHIGIIGHCTAEELAADLRRVDMANGFGNRFLWIWSERCELLPDPPIYMPNPLHVRAINQVIRTAANAGIMQRSAAAKELWDHLYRSELGLAGTGLVGAMNNRSEAQTVRLSMLYALLGNSQTIEPEHLESAVALVRYSKNTVNYLFAVNESPDAKRLIEYLSATGGRAPRHAARTIAFNHRYTSHDFDLLINELVNEGRIEVVKIPTAGRSTEEIRLL